MVGRTWRSSQRNRTTSKLENHPQKPSKSIQRQCLKSSSGTSAPCCVFFGCQAWTNRIRRQAECGWLRQSLKCHVACTWQVEVPKNWRALEHMAKTGFIYLMQSTNTPVTRKFRTTRLESSASHQHRQHVQTGFLWIHIFLYFQVSAGVIPITPK